MNNHKQIAIIKMNYKQNIFYFNLTIRCCNCRTRRYLLLCSGFYFAISLPCRAWWYPTHYCTLQLTCLLCLGCRLNFSLCHTLETFYCGNVSADMALCRECVSGKLWTLCTFISPSVRPYRIVVNESVATV